MNSPFWSWLVWQYQEPAWCTCCSRQFKPNCTAARRSKSRTAMMAVWHICSSFWDRFLTVDSWQKRQGKERLQRIQFNYKHLNDVWRSSCFIFFTSVLHLRNVLHGVHSRNVPLNATSLSEDLNVTSTETYWIVAYHLTNFDDFFFFTKSNGNTPGWKKGTHGAPKFVIIINIGMSTFEELSSISLNT